MTDSDSLDRLVFDLLVGRTRVEDLPGTACKVMTDGPDCPGLRLLAALSRVDVRQDPRHAWALLRQVIDELGLKIPPSFCEALAFQMRAVARRLANGECTVRDAVSAIDSLAYTGNGWWSCPEIPLVEFVVDADNLAEFEWAGDRVAADKVAADFRQRLVALLDEPS